MDEATKKEYDSLCEEMKALMSRIRYVDARLNEIIKNLDIKKWE